MSWRFNGWGQQAWARWDNDRHIAAHVADMAAAERIDADLVDEGGGVHVDGQGIVLLIETVRLDSCRNPGLDRAEVETAIADATGAHTQIGCKRGLYRD